MIRYAVLVPISIALGALVTACGSSEGSEASDDGAGEGPGGSGATAGAASAAGSSGVGGSGGSLCEPDLPELAAGLHVSPTGSPDGAGTEDDPLDLPTALSASGPVQPGDVIYVAGGSYQGRFTSELQGSPDAPIVVRALPGERVVIDGNVEAEGTIFTVQGEWTHFIGFEITSTDPNRETDITGSSPADITRGGGVTVLGPNTKIINFVVHDTAQGISCWTPAVDSELYGNIIYNNGWNAPDRGHGHAIYTQNLDGTKRITANIMFFGYSFGIHAYTEGGSIQGFDIVDNVWFNAGASVPGDDGLKDNCLVGGLQPAARVRLQGNLGWAASVSGRDVQLGYSDGVANEDATLVDNYLVGELRFSSTWNSISMSGNTVYGEVVGTDVLQYPDNTFSTTEPAGHEVFLYPNQYDPRRAHLVIYNWDDADAVDVELSGVVDEGASFEIHSVFDLFGEPVASGIYQGGSVSVALGTTPPPQPIGMDGAIVEADDPGRAFGVFLVTHTPCR